MNKLNKYNHIDIIAEIGVNHDGNFEKAIKLIREAKKCGVQIHDLNSESILSQVSVLVVSPGIPHLFPKPHPIIAKALKKGIVIDNDISLFFRSFALPI